VRVALGAGVCAAHAMPEANKDKDGPFHLRFWMQTKPRKVGMCYNHLPRNIPELAHRIGLSMESPAESIYRLPAADDNEKPPDEIDMKGKNGAGEWKAFLQRISTEGDPMAICNMGYCYFNGARSTVGVIFEEKDIDAPPGTSTGTEIAAFVDDPGAKWDPDWGMRAIDLVRAGELEAGDRILKVDGMDATDENVYELLNADDVPGSSLTITVQRKADVLEHRQDKHHKSQPPKILKLCRLERMGSRRDQMKQKAIDMWKKAAERGNAGASYNLGYCYTFGVVVKQDDQIASDWFAKFHRARVAERLCFRQHQKAL
jgi:hypothetical protein